MTCTKWNSRRSTAGCSWYPRLPGVKNYFRTICTIADGCGTDSGARWNCWRLVSSHKRFHFQSSNGFKWHISPCVWARFVPDSQVDCLTANRENIGKGFVRGSILLGDWMQERYSQPQSQTNRIHHIHRTSWRVSQQTKMFPKWWRFSEGSTARKSEVAMKLDLSVGLLFWK